MDGTVYWYYLNGRLKEHIIPPMDPSSVTFATIKTTDTGYKQVRAEVTLCVEGTYMRPKIFISELYTTPKRFREIVEDYTKQIVGEQRRITDWTGPHNRVKNSKKSTTKRCKCK